jgi:hypothetical protein
MSNGVPKLAVVLCAFIAGPGNAFAQPLRLAGSTCERPATLRCPEGVRCPSEVVTSGGTVTEPKTGRTYFLDYPCNLKKGDKVTFVLSLHGGGSYGNWQRHYFPLVDYADKYRLVIATPFSPARVWAASDDGYLQNIVTSVIDQIGGENIKAFWLAGHSQGGATSSRIICSDFFKNKVDGFVSLSGGRVGGSPQRGTNFGNLGRGPARGGADARGAAGGADASRGRGDSAAAPGRGRGPASPPTCDFSHIFETGEHEIGALPTTTAWGEKYACDVKPKHSTVVDAKAGYVYDSTRQDPGSKGWGLLPRPGKADVFNYRGCRDGRVVADVVRLDKGHTEGLEPKVTEEIVKLMVSAKGGKLQRSPAHH